METEDLVYNVESLIAEFGGTLLVTSYCDFFVRASIRLLKQIQILLIFPFGFR